MLCVILPKEHETLQYSHTHPSKPVYGASLSNSFFACDAWKILTGGSYYCNNQCYYIIHKSFSEFPSLIKLPCHQEHTLTFSHSSRVKSVTGSVLQCTDCKFNIGPVNALIFNHPNHKHELWFLSRNGTFWCDACGEGFRMECVWKNDGCNFDLHLECFALPGNIRFHSNQHSHEFLHLVVTQQSSSSKSWYCNVC